jgi:hypothetical protein
MLGFDKPADGGGYQCLQLMPVRVPNSAAVTGSIIATMEAAVGELWFRSTI